MLKARLEKVSSEEEWNTRNALLGHYSMQAAAHVTLLLTFALVGLAIAGLKLQKLALVFGLSIVIAAFVRTLGRTLYWGHLSHAIILVANSLASNRETLMATSLKEDLEKGYISPERETFRLHSAAYSWVRKKNPWATWFASLADKRGGLLTIISFVLEVLILWFCYDLVFVGP